MPDVETEVVDPTELFAATSLAGELAGAHELVTFVIGPIGHILPLWSSEEAMRAAIDLLFPDEAPYVAVRVSDADGVLAVAGKHDLEIIVNLSAVRVGDEMHYRFGRLLWN
jgi:hypothetical protein